MTEELYAAFYEQLLHYCAALARDRTAGEDLTQETFLRAMTHLEDLQDLNQNQRRAWLYRTAKNLYIDQVRKHSRETAVDQEQLEIASYEEDMSQAVVAGLVGRLPERERELFSLRYFAGYNASELGDLFDLPPSTVRARLASARRKLLCWYQEFD